MRQPNTARSALLNSFFVLMMKQRYSSLSVGALCKDACVGRSTFYMHFKNLDAVLLAVITPMIADLALGLSNNRHRSNAQSVLEHFWEQRRLSELWRDAVFRDLFKDQLTRALTETPEMPPRAAGFCAAGITETLRQWIGGKFSSTPSVLYDELLGLVTPALHVASENEGSEWQEDQP